MQTLILQSTRLELLIAMMYHLLLQTTRRRPRAQDTIYISLALPSLSQVQATQMKLRQPRKRQRLQGRVCRFVRKRFPKWDDWYHRGPALVDLDLYTYAEQFERCPKPKASSSDDPLASIRAFQNTHGLFFAFDSHYPLAKLHVQVNRRKGCIPKLIGSACPRAHVNEGEDNALFKAVLFLPRSCPARASALTHVGVLWLCCQA